MDTPAPPRRRWLRVVAFLLLAIALAGIVALQYLRSSLPQVSGTLALPGLKQPVEIVRDRHGVPHIHAATVEEANFALGFAHAQDRLWQMEMNRRIAAGRIAEILGPAALEADRFLRTLGVRRSAEAALPHLDAQTHAILQAYADGVNAFLRTNHKPLPPEFVLLRHHPEPWTPTDSVAWIKMMAWDLATNWKDELLRMRLSRQLSPEQIAQLLAPYPGDPPQVLRGLPELYRSLAEAAGALMASAPTSAVEGEGSNNWAVDGARSATGKPLLANDPHLGLTTPSLWYFAHLEALGLRTMGATLPGVPMVVLGRTDRIAWGFTNTGPDTQDLFIEKIEADADSYLTPDGPRRFEIRSETLRVKGAPDITLRVRESRHGPVISDVLPDAAKLLPKGYALAFAWTTLRDDDLSAQALVKLGQMRNLDEFLENGRAFHSPQQNVLYADVDGNIAFIAPGRVPLRRADNELKGLAPAPGWDAKYDWQGFIPYEELPRRINPPEGSLASANEKIVPDGYPHWITSAWQAPFRARRIHEMLDARDSHDMAGFAAMQADVRSLYARELLPRLMGTAPADDASRAALALLARWDGTMAGNRPEPLVFNAWVRQLTRAVYADELGEAFAGNWLERPLFMLNVLYDRDGQGRWCDDVGTPKVETCDEQLARTLAAALAELRLRHGTDMGAWRWSDAHAAQMDHRPFSNLPALAPFFAQQAPVPGDTWTVNVGRISVANEQTPFATRHAATLRALYDFSDLDRSRYIHPTGQSGNPFSPRYASFRDRWAQVDYVPMSMRREDFGKGAIGTLRLVPGR